MRHYTWNGSGGSVGAEKKEVIPNAGDGADIPIGTGIQPKDYDKANNFNPSVDSVSGYSERRVALSNSSEARAMTKEVQNEERVAKLMPKTGAK